MSNNSELELSIVIPCLNEKDTVAKVVAKAVQSIKQLGLQAEVIVADNGSKDGSQALAKAEGARVVDVREPGYGAALMGGIEAARGQFILMGDADDSYDFSKIEAFVEGLRKGSDLVQGCRLPAGGGTVAEGAMPITHRWIGNPLFTFLARTWFGTPIHDIYCGMRAFRRDRYMELNQRCTGMEFATEMIIKSTLYGFKITEVPITLHKDGRIDHPPHLKTIRDGWRTLRFFLLYSPRWLFLFPALFLLVFGSLTSAAGFFNWSWLGMIFDAHTLLVGNMTLILSALLIQFGVFTKTFAISENLRPYDATFMQRLKWFSLERSLFLALILVTAGVSLITYTLFSWQEIGFGGLDYSKTMKSVIPGTSMIIMGLQSGFTGFLISLLTLRRK